MDLLIAALIGGAMVFTIHIVLRVRDKKGKLMKKLFIAEHEKDAALNDYDLQKIGLAETRRKGIMKELEEASNETITRKFFSAFSGKPDVR